LPEQAEFAGLLTGKKAHLENDVSVLSKQNKKQKNKKAGQRPAFLKFGAQERTRTSTVLPAST